MNEDPTPRKSDVQNNSKGLNSGKIGGTFNGQGKTFDLRKSIEIVVEKPEVQDEVMDEADEPAELTEVAGFESRLTVTEMKEPSTYQDVNNTTMATK